MAVKRGKNAPMSPHMLGNFPVRTKGQEALFIMSTWLAFFWLLKVDCIVSTISSSLSLLRYDPRVLGVSPAVKVLVSVNQCVLNNARRVTSSFMCAHGLSMACLLVG